MYQESICLVSAQYLPHIGGVERYTSYLAKELKAQGHKVTIVTSEFPECPVKENVDGILILRLPSWRPMDGRYPVVKPGRVLRMIVDELGEQKLTHVLINTRFYPISLWAARMAFRHHVPCTVIEHGTAHLQMGKFTFVAEWAEHILTTFLKRYHPFFMGVSKTACDWSRHFGIENSIIAHNAIDVEEVEQIEVQDRHFLCDKYHIPNEGFLILYAGRLIPEKGLIQLAEAVESLAKDHIIHLILAGDGPLLHKLTADFGASVQCIGSVSHDEVLQLLHICDCFCLPSDSEGFPTVVLEAAACKAHVVATQYGGTGEIMPDERYGVCLKDNNTGTIKEGLLKTMQDASMRHEQAEKLYERVKTNYSWKQTADVILRHLGECSKQLG